MKFSLIPRTLQQYAAVAGVQVVMFGEEPQSAYKITREHHAGCDTVVVSSAADVRAVLYAVCEAYYNDCKPPQMDFVARFMDKYTYRFCRTYHPDMLTEWNRWHSDKISVEKIK